MFNILSIRGMQNALADSFLDHDFFPCLRKIEFFKVIPECVPVVGVAQVPFFPHRVVL